jgi:RNA polymerase sigma factor (sigma-70 family)
MFKRRVKDSQGNWGQIILFSELSNPDGNSEEGNESMGVEEIAENFISHIPNLGFGDTNSVNDEEKERYINLLKFAFTLLTPKQQLVVYLYFYKNKNYTEISRIVKVSPSAIRQDMQVAIKNLRKVLLGGEKELKKRRNLQNTANNRSDIQDLFNDENRK